MSAPLSKRSAMLSRPAVMMEPNKGVFAILDMGSTKTLCLIVKVRKNYEPEVIGIGYKAAHGVDGGAITNKQQAGYSILSSVGLAEQVSGNSVDQVYVVFSGCNISSHNISNEIVSEVREITERDTKRVFLQTYEKFSGDDAVIHNMPIAYHLDDTSNVAELHGLYGSRLRADMHVVTASRPSLMNIESCITSNNLSVGGCVVEPYASGLSCLTEDEKELGTMILDIGGNHASIGIFDRGRFVYSNSISLGGTHITRDVAYGLCTSVKDAERIKVLHGSVMANFDRDYAVEVGDSYDQDRRTVMKSELARIIQPRAEEILELVRDEIEGQKNIISKVVITGGSSNLFGIQELASHMFDRQVRIGLPNVISGMNNEHRNPVFSAAIGAVLLVMDAFYGKKGSYFTQRQGVLKKMLGWIAG